MKGWRGLSGAEARNSMKANDIVPYESQNGLKESQSSVSKGFRINLDGYESGSLGEEPNASLCKKS